MSGNAFYIISCIVAVAPIPEARPDGCFVPPKEVGRSQQIVASPKQEAVLVTDGKRVQVILRTHFRSGPSEVAWIVPVPAKPDKVEVGDEELFVALEEETAPRFFWPGLPGKGFACGCGAVLGDALGPLPSVVVEDSGEAGIFQYVVLSANRTGDLTEWLDEHEYFVPDDAERAFARYVDMGWHWLALRVRPELSNSPTLAPQPISYTYRSRELVYPLAISRLSADDEIEVVLYVFGRDRFGCDNWANGTIDSSRLSQGDSPSRTNYESLFREATRRENGRLFVTEFADEMLFPSQPHPGWARRGFEFDDIDKKLLASLGSRPTLTRLRAVMLPEAMDRDLLLKALPGAGKVDNVLYLAHGGTSENSPDWSLLPLAFLILLLWVRRAGRSGRAGSRLSSSFSAGPSGRRGHNLVRHASRRGTETATARSQRERAEA